MHYSRTITLKLAANVPWSQILIAMLALLKVFFVEYHVIFLLLLIWCLSKYRTVGNFAYINFNKPPDTALAIM